MSKVPTRLHYLAELEDNLPKPSSGLHYLADLETRISKPRTKWTKILRHIESFLNYVTGIVPISEEKPSAPHLTGPEHLRMKCERLTTQLMDLRRQISQLQADRDSYKQQYLSLSDAVCDYHNVAKSLQETVVGKNAGRLLAFESYTGTVSRVIGDQAEVVYSLADGPFKQVYDKEQFFLKKLPEQGDPVAANVLLLYRHEQATPDTGDEIPELPSFKHLVKKPPLRL